MKVQKKTLPFTLKSPFLILQKSDRLNYCFYPFIFPRTFLKYKLLKDSLFLKTLIIQTHKLNFLKHCYTNFLKQKKIFTQYLYEFNFLKCSYFSSLFSSYLKQRETTLVNVPLLTNPSGLKNLSNFSEFSNFSLKQRLKRIKSMNFLKIVPLFVNKSHSKDLLISHTVQLYAQQIESKRKKAIFLNLSTNDSILYYSSELQTQVYKITNYSKSKKKQNTEFSFFKIYPFILKYIINLFTLESLHKYDTSKMNLKSKKSKFTNLRTLEIFEFQPWQDQSLNYEMKSTLYMLQYSFFKNRVSECINFVHLNHFYDHMFFNSSDKCSEKSTSLFEEFIKKLYLKNLSSSNLNLILFKCEKTDLKSPNEFAISKMKILSFDNLEFIYRKLRCFSKIYKNFHENIFFSDLNKNINPLNLLFLNCLSKQNFNPCFSKYLEKQLLETFIFDKIIQMKFSRFKKYVLEPFKKKYTHLKKNQIILESIMIGFIIKVKGRFPFFQSNLFNKYFSLEFSYFLFAYKLKTKFLKYLRIYLSYSMIFLYIEKNSWQVLVLTNQFFSILNESFSLRIVQCWFSSLKIESDFYLYTFHKAHHLNNDVQKKIETEIKNNNKKFVIIYKNFLFVFLNSKKFFKLPKKGEHKTYLNSLKKTVKTYSNKNQIFLIEVLNEKVYSWSYNYRFIFIPDYFLQLDQKLFKFLWTWAIRRHNNKSKNWIKTKYFHTLTKKNWIFGSYTLDEHKPYKLQGSTKFIYIPFHSQVLFNFRNSL